MDGGLLAVHGDKRHLVCRTKASGIKEMFAKVGLYHSRSLRGYHYKLEARRDVGSFPCPNTAQDHVILPGGSRRKSAASVKCILFGQNRQWLGQVPAGRFPTVCGPRTCRIRDQWPFLNYQAVNSKDFLQRAKMPSLGITLVTPYVLGLLSQDP
jgi:hypothetical protein